MIREYRPWGFFETILEDFGFKVKRIVVNPGKRLSLQSHRQRSEHWTVVRGVATIWINDKIEDVKYNESRYIPKEAKHRLENKSPVEDIHVIEVQCGGYLGEDDIVRYEDDYDRS